MGKVGKIALGIGTTIVGFVVAPIAPPLGAALIKLGIGMTISGTLSLIAGNFTKKPSGDLKSVQQRMHVSVDPNTMGKWVFGETAFATDVLYAEQHGPGTDKGQYSMIVAAASHEITSYDSLYITDELITYGGGTEGWATGPGDWAEGGNTVWRSLKTGTLTQTAIVQSGSGWNYPATATCKGLAHYCLSFILNKKKLSGGVPTRITYKGKGIKVYDPRKDTTNGGSGSHRYTDQSTWEFTSGGTDIGKNWALLVAQYLLGWHGENIKYNKVINGAFTTDTDWTKGTGWTINTGTGKAVATGVSSTDLEQSIAVVDGCKYILQYTVVVTSGSVTPYVGGTAGTARSTSGTFSELIVGGSSNELLEFRGTSFTGTIDDVSVKAQLVFGVGVDPDDIDWDQVIAAANVCDALIDGIPRYRIGGLLETSNDHQAVLSQLESAIGGKISQMGGKWYIWAPNDDLTAYSSIGEDDLLRDVGVEFVPSGPIEDLYNVARGQYVSPDLLYQPVEYPEVREETAIVEDGRERLLSYDFSLVQDVSIAQRVARMLVRRSRFTATWKFAMGPKGLLFKPFDVTTLNIQETNFEDVLVRIINMEYTTEGVVAIECLEEDSSIYNTGDALGTSVTQNDPIGFTPSLVVDVVNLASSDISLTGDSGTVSDALKITWDDPGSLVAMTEVQYKIASESDYQQVGQTKIGLTYAIISPVERLTLYDIRARHITIFGVVRDWESIIPIQDTAGDTVTLDPSVIGYTGDLDADNTGRNAGGLLNPNFEGGDTGWAKGTGCTIVNDANVISGTYSARFENSSTAGFANDAFLSATAGDTITFVIRAKKTSGTATCRVEMYSFDAAGTPLSGVGSFPYQYNDTVLTPVSTVLTCRGTFQVLPGTVKIKFQIYVIPTGGTAIAYFDNADYSRQSAPTNTDGLINPYFEDGDVGWDKGTGCSIIFDPTNAFTGNWVAYIASTGTADTGYFNQRKIAATPGDRIFAACYAKKTAGPGTTGLWISWYKANGDYITSASSSNTSSSYVRIPVIGVAPADTAYCVISPKLLGPDATSRAYFDQFEYAKYPKNSDIDALATTNGPAEAGADVTANSASDIIFYQSAAPSSPQEGWTWVDTDDSRIYRRTSGSWVQIAALDALLLTNAPTEAGADVTQNAIANPFIYDKTITIGNNGGWYGYDGFGWSGTFGSLSPDAYFISKRLDRATIAYIVWLIGASTNVRMGLLPQSITNDDETFYSIQIGAQTALLRSAASYATSGTPAAHAYWQWTGIDTTGYPTSGTVQHEIISQY
jgi:hypothetical protein